HEPVAAVLPADEQEQRLAARRLPDFLDQGLTRRHRVAGHLEDDGAGPAPAAGGFPPGTTSPASPPASSAGLPGATLATPTPALPSRPSCLRSSGVRSWSPRPQRTLDGVSDSVSATDSSSSFATVIENVRGAPARSPSTSTVLPIGVAPTRVARDACPSMVVPF